MTSPHRPDRCPACGAHKEAGFTTFTTDFGTGVVVVRDVPATLCSQCGAEWLDDAIAEKLEKIVAEAREKRTLVEITCLSARR